MVRIASNGNPSGYSGIGGGGDVDGRAMPASTQELDGEIVAGNMVDEDSGSEY